MLVDASDRSEGREPLDIPIPTPVVDAASHLLSLLRERASASAETPQTITVPEAPDATALIERSRKEADAFWREAKGADNGAAMALWARAHERACKLALIYAVSEHPDAPQITAEGFEWGRALSWHVTRRMLAMGRRHVVETQFDATAKKILRRLEKVGQMTHSALLKASHLDRDKFRTTMETLVEAGNVRRTLTDRGGFYTFLSL